MTKTTLSLSLLALTLSAAHAEKGVYASGKSFSLPQGQAKQLEDIDPNPMLSDTVNGPSSGTGNPSAGNPTAGNPSAGNPSAGDPNGFSQGASNGFYARQKNLSTVWAAQKGDPAQLVEASSPMAALENSSPTANLGNLASTVLDDTTRKKDPHGTAPKSGKLGCDYGGAC